MRYLKSKRIVIGGCFLIIHPGHIYLLKQAKETAEEVWVVLAHDNVLKEKYGFFISQKEREQVLRSISVVDRVIRGTKQKKYTILKEVDAIGLGYDQDISEYKSELLRLKERYNKHIKVIRFNAYKPEVFSTSKLLNIEKLK